MTKIVKSYIHNEPITPNYCISFKAYLTENNEEILIHSFEDGIIDVMIRGYAVSSVNDYARIISGCFEEGSNFINMLKRDYNQEEFKGIKFKNRRISILVTEENSNIEQIMQTWQDKYNELFD